MKKLLFLLIPLSVCAGPNEQLVADWINAQANVHTWTADFKEIRELKALTEPLTATGKIWFSAPDHFRWEVMKPAPTIATRTAEDLLVIFPRLKRAEKYSLATLRQGQWKDLMSLLDTGFPRSKEDFEKQFHVRDVVDVPGGRRLVLDPKSDLVKKYLPEIDIDIRTPDFMLLGTTMVFVDGSILKNEFSNPQVNQPIDAAVFTPPVLDYKVTQPLSQ
jgi:outer membrane lipoprotein-sorting protein